MLDLYELEQFVAFAGSDAVPCCREIPYLNTSYHTFLRPGSIMETAAKTKCRISGNDGFLCHLPE